MSHVLIVSASHRVRSTSASIAEYLAARIDRGACEVTDLNLAARGALKGDFSALADALPAADVVVLVSPLYHDAPSSAAMGALACLFEHRHRFRGSPAFLAVVHSGYPEPVHCSVALEICRQAALETGMEWLGGFSRGGSSLFDGRPLTEGGAMARGLCQALDLAAAAVAKRAPLPPRAAALAARFPIPRCLFVLVGTYRMWRRACQEKVADLHARPFAS